MFEHENCAHKPGLFMARIARDKMGPLVETQAPYQPGQCPVCLRPGINPLYFTVNPYVTVGFPTHEEPGTERICLLRGGVDIVWHWVHGAPEDQMETRATALLRISLMEYCKAWQDRETHRRGEDVYQTRWLPTPVLPNPPEPPTRLKPYRFAEGNFGTEPTGTLDAHPLEPVPDAEHGKQPDHQ